MTREQAQKIDEQAAEWLVRLENREQPPTPAQQTAFFAWLARSPLLRLPTLATGTIDRPGPDNLRCALGEALHRLREQAAPPDDLPFRALDLAYLQRETKAVQAAAQLAVSRATYFRFLKRGIHALTAELSRQS